ncbi:alpha carbonic anhydrase [Venturia nashicola]|uniref:Carbonic anhydrase n=1 Tax=Venturia nashicola TaxID=86259 RepID=A0A4Z1P3L4_9PEZI|nr:alpha carbonic anhydrase [Venturia nashicola]TLD20221.1 alpha carbonic anhydrase [Venturia nashicola]
MMLIQSVFVTTLLAVADATCMGHLHRRAAKSNTVEVSNFGYSGSVGPLLWQTLAEENSACEKGENQSPINIDSAIKRATSPPKIHIAKIDHAEFENLGTTVEVIANGTTDFGNKTFSLKQFHFHSPSEHRINEEYFPLEMHMVHQSNDGSFVVLGLLFDVSELSTPLVSELAKEVRKISEPGSITETGPLDMAAIIKHLETTALRQYSGSLTTPPCKEGITFLIAEQPLPIDPLSFNSMKKVLKFNSRFTQGSLGEPNLIEKALKGSEGIIVNAPASNSSSVATSKSSTASNAVKETAKPSSNTILSDGGSVVSTIYASTKMTSAAKKADPTAV